MIFLILTLVISLLVKRLSHDILNWIYDKYYRNSRRKNQDSWYQRAVQQKYLADDPLVNQYEAALQALKKNNNPVVAKIVLIQIQSKLARSMTLFLILFAAMSILNANIILFVFCLTAAVYFLYVFFKTRWEASESVYQARLEELNLSII